MLLIMHAHICFSGKLFGAISKAGYHIISIQDFKLSCLQVTATRQDDNERYASIPESLQKSLMEFQRTGVRFGLSRGGRILIGDEMGLGKTVQAVALLAAYRDKWPALIITPASLRGLPLKAATHTCFLESQIPAVLFS